MKSLSIGCAVAVLVGVAGCAGSPPAASSGPSDIVHDAFPDEVAAIREVFDSIQGIVDRRDLEALRAIHLNSPKFTKFGRKGGRMSFEDMVAQEEAGLSAAQEVKLEFRDLRIDVYGDVAVSTCEPRFTLKFPNGDVNELEVRSTVVWVKTPNGWKMAHEHNSASTTE